MILLRRVLGVGALVLIVVSLPLLIVPDPLVDGILGQTSLRDTVWVRLFAIAGLTLALLHVLVIRRLEDLWWWCWAFVLFDALVALVSIVHAAVGVGPGSAAWPWWTVGAMSTLFAAMYLGGIAKAGQEKPLL